MCNVTVTFNTQGRKYSFGIKCLFIPRLQARDTKVKKQADFEYVFVYARNKGMKRYVTMKKSVTKLYNILFVYCLFAYTTSF